jgi:hypothetical protein
MLGPALWVLTRHDRRGPRIVGAAESPDHLAFLLRRPPLNLRAVLMMVAFAASLTLLVSGSLANSAVWVVAASLATCVSLVKLSDCLIESHVGTPAERSLIDRAES